MTNGPIVISSSQFINNRAIDLTTRHFNPVHIALDDLTKEISVKVPMNVPGYFEQTVLNEHGRTQVIVTWTEVPYSEFTP